MTERERRFVARAIRRKRLFLGVAGLGVVVGLGLAVHLGWRWATTHDGGMGIHLVVVILVLLNGRQNLRQFRYAGILEKLTAGGAGAAESDDSR